MRISAVVAGSIMGLTLALSGCASYRPSGVSSFEAQRGMSVRYGTIQNIHAAQISGHSGVGTLGGGTVGALAGSALGNNAIAVAGGAILGAIAGAQVERAANSGDVLVTVALRSGQTVAVAQGAQKPPLAIGEAVEVIDGGGKLHVLPAQAQGVAR